MFGVPVVDVLEVVLPRVATVVAFISVGVFAANLLVDFGAVRYVAALAKPLTGPANLPSEVGSAILTTAASTTAGYGMLAEFRESGALDDRATLVAVTINTFFGFAQHVFTFYAPVLIPILGLRMGLLYVGFRAGIALAITVLGVLAGALLLSDANVDRAKLGDVEADAPGEEAKSTRAKLRSAAETTASRLRSILPRLLVVYLVLEAVLMTVDVTRHTGPLNDVAVALTGLPVESVPVVVAFTFNTTVGALTAASLVPETLTVEQGVAAMLLGGVFSFAVSTFKRSIPFQYGIWGPTFGSKVIAVNVATKVVFVALALALLLAV
ncbi:nucleoside recognition protein [Halarchaeum sp. CBA1220]|uniref:nucleoside recognition protein n=1 Tax=Halarchaeum sp. CBA1220 TaxID=1853682 RepID=UPI000F3AA53C|nr:nucleoside recognition protein [Halarchaeum sp. CBA1220]QLC33426.1 nucleoside recognition protein [Halarchaeum sp. CBA1220]